MHTVISGSTHDAYRFGKQVYLSLSVSKRFPISFYPKQTSPIYSHFLEHFALNPTPFPAFKLLLFVIPKIKQPTHRGQKIRQPTKNQHHWILVSKFYATFFDQFLAEWGYKENSKIFARDFCEIIEKDLKGWLENFHIHFISEEDVGPDMSSWKNFLVSQHRSDLTDLMRYNPTFIEFNTIKTDESDQFSDVGYIDVDTLKLYDECQQRMVHGTR